MIQLIGNTYLMRAPLYPVQFADKCFEGHIGEWASRNDFLYGVYLSSKDLYLEYKKQAETGVFSPKMHQTLRKYWLRASARCTPYANLAGCTLGTIAENTHIYLEQPDKHTEACRMDMNMVYKFIDVLNRNSELMQQVLFYPNNTLYKLGGKYRYVRYKVNGNKRKYFLSEAAYTPYLEDLLQAAAKGSTLPGLAGIIAAYGFEQEEIMPYLHTLIDNQVISSELEPCVSGEQPFNRLAAVLQKYPAARHYADFIEEVNRRLIQNDFSIDRLETIIQRLEQEQVDYSGVTTLFQSDMCIRAKHNTIGHGVMKQVLKEINQLVQATYKKKFQQQQLDEFKNRFFQRYEMQEVPLCEALDVECGIGYGNYSNHLNSFVSDINFTTENNADEKTGELTRLLQQLLETRDVADVSPIHFTEKDLGGIKQKEEAPLAFANSQFMSVMGCLYGSSAAEIDKGNFQFLLKSIGAPSSANILARFCHMDESISNWVTALTHDEEAALPEQMVYAEIIHLPQERVGNILLRPVLRQYEIPYQGNSGAPENRQLPVADLLVSIRNNQIVLRSRKLNKRVIPRLTTAHNYSFDSLPMYKFLCDLQHQQSFAGVGFESLLSNNNSLFTPRVTFGHLILKRANWKLQKEDLKGMPADDTALQAFVAALRQRKKLPQRVLFQQNDNELLIDFAYADAFRLLASYIDKYGAVQLAEFLYDETMMGAVEGADGNYCNELLFPAMIAKTAETGQGYLLSTVEADHFKRVFLPGDEWLYFKIYCSSNAAEELLAAPVRKLVAALVKKGWVKQCFFLRYADPEMHIRIRFQLQKNEDFLPVMQAVRKALDKYQRSKMLTTIQIDTYVREIERYGGKTIAESEAIFCSDSQAVLNILHRLHLQQAEDKKWEIAMTGIDSYLKEFGYSLKDKIRLLSRLQKAFFAEFGGSLPLQRSLNEKYRTLKDRIFALFDKASTDKLLNECRKEFRARSMYNRHTVHRLKTILQRQQRNADDLLGSYLHMFIIRLFAAENRKYELTLYHLLLKYYQAIAAIQEKATK